MTRSFYLQDIRRMLRLATTEQLDLVWRFMRGLVEERKMSRGRSPVLGHFFCDLGEQLPFVDAELAEH